MGPLAMGERWPPAALPLPLPEGLLPMAKPLLSPTPDAGPPTRDPQPTDARALNLYACLLEADSVHSGLNLLAARLAESAGLDRVSIGLLQRGRLVLVASSQPGAEREPTDRDQLVQGAMAEAVDHGLALCWPAAAHPANPQTPHISPPAVEQRLLQQHVGGAVASLPLGHLGQAMGAVCVERQRQPDGPPFSDAELLRLGRQLALAAPALHWMQAASQPWHRRARTQWRAALGRLQRPAGHRRRQVLALVALLVAMAAFVPLPDTVNGRARLEGARQQVVSAPTDGFVQAVHVRPGDRVAAGAALVDLQDQDLRLERARWQSQLVQHENAYASAMGRADRTNAATSQARFNEAQAQLALVDAQLARGRLVAPFDALVVQGDLSQSIGAPVRQGDALITLASDQQFRVVVEVDEVDIGRVQPGQRGQLSVSALPWHSTPIVVERIAPLAKPVQGRNVFEVEARLDAPAGALRPGLLGRAELNSGEAPLLLAWGERALLRLRVALWTWLA